MSNTKLIDKVIQEGKWMEALAPPTLSNDPPCQTDCIICGGIGFVRQDLPVGHPQFGKLQPCPNRNPDPSPGYAKKYGLNRHDRGLDWKDILPMEGSNILEIAGQVQSAYERGYGWVYLWGPFGNGKSLILQVAAACALRSGREAAYIRMAEVMDLLRQGYQTDDYSERLEWLQSLPVLCIDEFERVAEKQASGLSWVAEKRFVLMDVRYVSAGRGETLTIMAGNTDPSRFTFDDGYLWDRINDNRFKVLHVTGPSARPGMEWDPELEKKETNAGIAFEDGRRAALDRGENF